MHRFLHGEEIMSCISAKQLSRNLEAFLWEDEFQEHVHLYPDLKFLANKVLKFILKRQRNLDELMCSKVLHI